MLLASRPAPRRPSWNVPPSTPGTLPDGNSSFVCHREGHQALTLACRAKGLQHLPGLCWGEARAQ